MRLKRLRRARKIVSFFKTAGHFKPPFEVLLDGTAIQAALQLEMNLEEVLPKVLGDKVKLLVPKAVVAELHVLGRKFSAAAKFSRRQKVVPPVGGEEPGASAALMALVANGNPKRFFVMTEDRGLCHQIGELQSVPLLRFARGQVVLELPSGRAAASTAMAPPQPKKEPAHAHNGSSDNVKRSSGADRASDGDRTDTAGPEAAGGSEVNTKKRKRLKEPNPLSCKKKKAKPGTSSGLVAGSDATAAGVQQGGGDSDGAPRKKVRRGGKKKGGETTAVST